MRPARSRSAGAAFTSLTLPAVASTPRGRPITSLSGSGAQAAIDADWVGRQILAGFGIVIAVEIIVQPDSRILPLSWEEQREGGGFAFRANIAATAFAQ